MGLTEASNKQYLRISHGKIAKSATPETPKAQSRVTKSGDTIFELIFNSLEGILEDITFRDHEEFGKSWTLHVKDGKDNYALQIQEDSRYGGDLLRKIPNLYRGNIYKFVPYDFTHNGKRKVGLSISQGDEKVEGYYQSFTQKKDGTWDVKNLHGFPEFTGDSKDKDDLKMYFMQVTKFLRPKALEHIKGHFQNAQPEKEVPSDEAPPLDDKDLPF